MSDPSDIRQASISSVPAKKTVSLSYNSHTVMKVVVAIIVVGTTFCLGLYAGDHHKSNPSTLSQNVTTGGSFGQFHRGRSGFGMVSAISTTSITISTVSGSSKTYIITSSTKITEAGQSTTTSSISNGDRVIVIPSSSDSSDAASIIVNPNFGGGFGAPSGSSTSNNIGSSTPTGGSATNSSTAN